MSTVGLVMRRVQLPSAGAGRRGSARRGMAMVLTVVLSLVACTVAMVVVQQALSASRSATARADQAVTARIAADVVGQFEAALERDPTFYTRALFFAERPRLCQAGISDRVVVASGDADAPAVPWPTDCDTVWQYLPVGQVVDGYDPSTVVTRAEVVPPSATDPHLTLRVLVTLGDARTTTERTYRNPSAADVTLYSSTALDLDTLAGPAGTTQVSGTVYSAGPLGVPTRPEHTIAGVAPLTAARLLTECAVTGAAGQSGVWAPVSPPTGCAPAPAASGDIRSLAPTELRIEAAARSVDDLTASACAAPQAPVTAAGTAWSTTLCVRRGAALTTTGGAVVTVADQVGAYRVLPGGTVSDPTVQVLVASGAPTDPPTAAEARSAYAAGTHPLSPPGAVWTELGTFALPRTGVLVTDATTYVGQCTAALSEGVCAPVATAVDVTVVAGTPAAPADVVIAGPVGAGDGAALGLVATGHLLFPFWAHVPGASLSVNAHTLMLGLDGTRAIASSADPAHPGGTLEIVGSLAAPNVATVQGYTRVSVNPAASPPARFPAFTQQWRPLSTSAPTDMDLCGQSSCSSSW